ncbi:MAX [Cordylochernes scorpioides]|uniref:MAX n=1 Tax=Cordylochernes scorpioides TaxID=51811 RepID=A0ABY6KLZ2_9ARAC|nr:MAX [Cordylochernes scorpioides]
MPYDSNDLIDEKEKDFDCESDLDKRAHHNALERKRRDLIKDSFTNLGDYLPTLRREKVSRAQILKKTADYIIQMKKKKKNLKMEQGREENPKEPMESDPDSESGENTFPKKENTLGRTQEVPPGQEDVTPPPPVSDVLGRLTTTLPQLSAVTGHRERWNRYDGSYKAQSFFTNYDAQADRAQLQYSTRLKKPPDLLQAPLRVTNTRAYVTCSPDHL